MLLFASGCKPLEVSRTPIPTEKVLPTSTITPSSTYTPIATSTITPSATPTLTDTATSTVAPSVTLTPTITQTVPPPEGYVSVAQANCRYGPGWAYLYKFGLYEGISVEIQGRTERGDWVFVLPLWYDS
ncbi:MAG TPA: hypothetical protein VMW34_02045, partial [Anaerolineales bacterium]|nr:hypothetical protein [Anaerolineales bacterium]